MSGGSAGQSSLPSVPEQEASSLIPDASPAAAATRKEIDVVTTPKAPQAASSRDELLSGERFLGALDACANTIMSAVGKQVSQLSVKSEERYESLQKDIHTVNVTSAHRAEESDRLAAGAVRAIGEPRDSRL